MKTIILETPTKIIHQSTNENEFVQEFKDDFLPGPAAKIIKIKSKGEFTNQFSSQIFKLLSSYHISSHFLKTIAENKMAVRKVNIIPVIVCIRNIATGSLVKNFGVEEGKELDCPLIEFYIKSNDAQDQIITEDHIISFGNATAGELKEMRRITNKINVILKDYLRRRSYKLVDFKVEFARYKENRLIIASEICLDTMHIMDAETNEIILNDKQVADKKYLDYLIESLTSKLF
ncbi:MAG TPA: phosphoribosylaminoimidazolesuccinocarboxamide synthase [bacterium]|nr:phosphoribosylaminoimidazolesuccinocarboxamide synthase [bacterium]HPN43625.1 phosphoribosylaminoimidazolesuccinocarboxamide synthase [bacterium]